MKKSKYIIVIIALFLNSIMATSQNSVEDKIIVENFVKAVFFEENTAQSISNKYFHFLPIDTPDNPNLSISDRLNILSEHLKKIKKEKMPLLDKKDYSIVPYNDYKNSKVTFSKETDNTYILISRGKPVMYFALQDSRIVSFDYITKGEEGFFILY